MDKAKRILALILSILAIATCSLLVLDEIQIRRLRKLENARQQIKAGMAMEQVKQILYKPNETYRTNSGEGWYWKEEVVERGLKKYFSGSPTRENTYFNLIIQFDRQGNVVNISGDYGWPKIVAVSFFRNRLYEQQDSPQHLAFRNGESVGLPVGSLRFD